MKYLFEISKKHKKLPTAEILTSLDSENINYEIILSDEDVLLIETDSKDDKLREIAGRLSYTFYIDKFLFSCNP